VALTAGARLGRYEITAQIGVGGMGEVWCATDTNLGRPVAIKILPDAFAHDPDRLARFEREAKTLASLSHPNIAIIHGLEVADGIRALVMELVEGPTLEDRIAQGPIPIDEALPIATQIAEALEGAHEQGVIHRDLKPANVKVRTNGTVKVLDFGLAKAMEPAGTAASSFSMRATITTPAMTQAGIILGTAAYMSPEQARGKTVDTRADIWAFGCVLYEMLTGEQLFRGETITDVLAAIVNSEPDLSKVSPRAQRLIRACLEKEARHRLQAIGDAWLLLESGAKTRQGGPQLSWGALLMALSVGIVAIAAAGMWARWRQATAERRPLQFQVHLPEGVRLVEGTSGGSALSPDGRTIAFVAMAGGVKRLWLRPFDSLPPRELTGTSGADFPFWSPDGRSIGFFAEGKLKRLDSSGGQPIVLAEAPLARGGVWTSDGTIIFGGSSGVLRRVSADTGPTTPVTTLNLANGENAHRWPQFLPGERRFLYWVRSSKPSRSGVYASSLDRPQDAVLVVANATNGLYSAPQGATVGYLLWARDNQIVAQMFDPERSPFVRRADGDHRHGRCRPVIERPSRVVLTLAGGHASVCRGRGSIPARVVRPQRRASR
jgi:eukaryotic-like serine/threonine-protein kinase